MLLRTLKRIGKLRPIITIAPTSSIKERLYDNIWFQSHFTEEFTGTYGVIEFDEVLFGNDDKKASLAASDHRPLWADFESSVADD